MPARPAMAQADGGGGGGGGGGSADWNLGTAASDGFDDGNVRL